MFHFPYFFFIIRMIHMHIIHNIRFHNIPKASCCSTHFSSLPWSQILFYKEYGWITGISAKMTILPESPFFQPMSKFRNRLLFQKLSDTGNVMITGRLIHQHDIICLWKSHNIMNTRCLLYTSPSTGCTGYLCTDRRETGTSHFRKYVSIYCLQCKTGYAGIGIYGSF